MAIPTKNTGDLLTAAEVNTLDDALDAVILSNAGKQDTSAKGQANGYAGLDGSAKLAKSLLPSLLTTDISGLGTIATQAANNVAITGGALDGVTIGGTTRAPAVTASRFAVTAPADEHVITFGGTDNATTSALFVNVRTEGSSSAAATTFTHTSPLKISISDRSVATNDLYAGMNLEMLTGISNSTGTQTGRIGIRSFIQANFRVGNAGYLPIVGMEAHGLISTNQGGVGGWTATSPEIPAFYTRGSIFGLNSYARATGTATNMGGVFSIEANWAVLAGASAMRKVGIVLVPNDDDIVQGQEVDAGITLAVKGSVAGNASAPIHNGLQFGVPSGFWPFNAQSIGILAVGRGSGRGSLGRPASITAIGGAETNLPMLRFIDMAEVLATDCQILGRGFRLEPLGDIVWTPRTSAPTLSVNGQLCIYAVSNTAVRIRYRGSDGTTRESANLTLA